MLVHFSYNKRYFFDVEKNPPQKPLLIQALPNSQPHWSASPTRIPSLHPVSSCMCAVTQASSSRRSTGWIPTQMLSQHHLLPDTADQSFGPMRNSRIHFRESRKSPEILWKICTCECTCIFLGRVQINLIRFSKETWPTKGWRTKVLDNANHSILS